MRVTACNWGILEGNYRYTPEFNQAVTIQPDGFVSLNLVGDVNVGGLSLDAALSALVAKATTRLRDPEISIGLKEYIKPHCTAANEVAAPGRFKLRGEISALEAVAMTGGLKSSAGHSQAILYRRRVGVDTAEAKLIDLRRITTLTGIREDITLCAGDMLFIPQNCVSKIER